MKGKEIALLIFAGLFIAVFFAFRTEIPFVGHAGDIEVISRPATVVNQSDNEHSLVDQNEGSNSTQTQSSGPKDCMERLVYAQDGNVYSGLECPSINQGEIHPYEDELVYSNDALEVMALNNDAIAAEVLGKRLIGSDIEMAFKMLVRASALSNDPSHLLWLSDQGFGATSVNGEINVNGVGRRYILARAAEIMSGDSPNAEQFRSYRVAMEEYLRDGDIPEDEIASLEKSSVKISRKIAEIQESSGFRVNEGGQHSG